MKTMTVTLSASLGALSLLAGCGLGFGGQGTACLIDSDCASGLLCSFENICAPPAAVVAKDTSPSDDAPVARRDVLDDGGDGGAVVCSAVGGVFEASGPPCADPATKLTVTGLVIVEAGTGIDQLAALGNPVIASGFEDGTLAMELWVDGTLHERCEHALAWVRGPEDRQADCTPVYSDTMPFVLPGLVDTVIERASLDPVTHRLTGLIDKEALLASMAPALRETTATMIVLDVDTDGDDAPDRASVLLDVSLAD